MSKCIGGKAALELGENGHSSGSSRPAAPQLHPAHEVHRRLEHRERLGRAELLGEFALGPQPAQLLARELMCELGQRQRGAASSCASSCALPTEGAAPTPQCTLALVPGYAALLRDHGTRYTDTR